MKKNHWILLGLALPALWLIWVGINQLGLREEISCSKGRIYEVVKEEVRRKLKAPYSAQFGPKKTVVYDTKINPCLGTMVGYVDSQNSFGAMIRNEFRAYVFPSDEQDSQKAFRVEEVFLTSR